MSARVEVVVGIDLGGTSMRAGALDRQGNLLSWLESPMEASRGPQQGIERIQALVAAALQQAGDARLLGIGIGCTGPLDRRRGAIQNPYTLPTWEDVDILAPLRRRFGVPAVLENDADAAALGEYWLGAGQGVSHLAVVTVGTGIGFAFVYKGEILRGLGDAHPDAGHQVIDPSGPPCYCGARGCWESLASGPAIARMGREAAGLHPGSRLAALVSGDLNVIQAETIVQAAGQGDPLAQEVVAKAAHYLALGLVNVVVFFIPEVILLGGGVMQRYDLFRPAVEEALQRHNVMVPAAQVQVRPVQLEGRAGVFGAAYAILKELESIE